MITALATWRLASVCSGSVMFATTTAALLASRLRSTLGFPAGPLGRRERPRRPVGGVRKRARRDGGPRRMATGCVVRGERPSPLPGRTDRHAPAGMPELDRGHRAEILEEGSD